METPSSSTKRVTRSQTTLSRNSAAASNNIPISRKIEDSELGISKSRRRNGGKQQQLQDRSALIDITNDSPIVGLAMGSLKTPSSGTDKIRSKDMNTPGSGEAILRGQVKSLLQRVEEEAELSKLTLENRPFLNLQGFVVNVNSPMGLLAPTPANTPQIPNLSEDGNGGLPSVISPLPVVEEQLKICQVVSEIFNGKKQDNSLESQKSLTRSLLFDFSEKSESSQGGDDNSSVWSIQANASTRGDEEDEEETTFQEQEEENDDYYDEEEEEDDGGLVDELCETILKISLNEKPIPKFAGKHKRFVYDSDGEELVGGEEDESSPTPQKSVIRLKGLPTPKGKHLRFPAEEEGEN